MWCVVWLQINRVLSLETLSKPASCVPAYVRAPVHVCARVCVCVCVGGKGLCVLCVCVRVSFLCGGCMCCVISIGMPTMLVGGCLVRLPALCAKTQLYEAVNVDGLVVVVRLSITCVCHKWEGLPVHGTSCFALLCESYCSRGGA
jgi:hypothetical protein